MIVQPGELLLADIPLHRRQRTGLYVARSQAILCCMTHAEDIDCLAFDREENRPSLGERSG